MSNIYKTKEYFAWCDMRKRCLSEKSKDYANYGGRGITIDERWNRFEDFLADVGIAPSKKHSLDRIDVNGNYEPGNIRWATWQEQQTNRRNSLNFTIDGVTRNLKAWAEIYGVKYVTAYHRVAKQNMPIEKALMKGLI